MIAHDDWVYDIDAHHFRAQFAEVA
jgi:hypothetical protein